MADNTYMKQSIQGYKIDPEKYKSGASSSSLAIFIPTDVGVDNNLEKLIDDLKNGSFARKHKRILYWNYDPPNKGRSFGSGEGLLRIVIANDVINNLPKTLYHWTERKNKESIMRGGLQPRATTNFLGGGYSGSYSAYPYKATFLTSNNAKLAKIRGFSSYKKNKKMALFSVDLPTNVKLYRDNNMDNAVYKELNTQNDFSFVVFDPIPKENVHLVFPTDDTE